METVITRQSKLFHALLSLIFGVGTYFLSFVFQAMPYWFGGMIWFWIGVVFTYLVGLSGAMFWVLSFKKRGGNQKLSSATLIFLRIISALVLGFGFIWTTFIIVAGMSGI